MIIKLLKTKDRQILKATRDDTLVMGKNNSNDIRFLIRRSLLRRPKANGKQLSNEENKGLSE